jgi:hypothetical protein
MKCWNEEGRGGSAVVCRRHLSFPAVFLVGFNSLLLGDVGDGKEREIGTRD